MGADRGAPLCSTLCCSAELLLEKGAIVLSLSDSQGYVYEVRAGLCLVSVV